MNTKYVAIYSNEYSEFVAVGPFDSDDEAQAYLDDMVARDLLREKDMVGTAELKDLVANEVH